MSNRERWIIYPMLFFAIALATKAKLDQAVRLDTDELFCRQLTVVDDDGQPKLKLVSDTQGGLIAVMNGQRGVAAVLSASERGSGVLQLSGAQRSDAVSIAGNDFGGQVRVAGGPKQPVVVFGFADDGSRSGLFALHDDRPMEQQPESHAAEVANSAEWGVPLPAPAASPAPPAPAADTSTDGSAASPAPQSPSSSASDKAAESPPGEPLPTQPTQPTQPDEAAAPATAED